MRASIQDLKREILLLRREEESLRRHEEHLRMLVEQMPAVLWTTDGELRFTSMAGAALRTVGVDAAAAVGSRVAYFFGETPGASPAAMHRRVLDGEARSFALKWKERVFQVWLEPLRDASGSLTGVIGVALDLTEQKLSAQAFQDLAASAAAWERGAAAAQAENRELKRVTEELKRSNAELDLFASVAGHDLQEPLRKIVGFGDQLSRRHSERLDAEGLDYLRRMRKAATRMGTLIESLLGYARVKTTGRALAAVDLNAVMDDVLLDVEESLARSHARVEVAELPAVQADALQMRQLLENLLTNALKFQAPGAAPRVTVSGEAAAGRVVLRVSDNGIGFEPRFKDQIFKPFTRLHPRAEFEGSGMGLAICRRIVERHGGTLDAVSEPGKGTTFTVTLPAAGAP